MPDLFWRPLTAADQPALVDLAQALLRADGGLPFLSALDAVQARFFADRPGARLGAFDGAGRLGCCRPPARACCACGLAER